MDDSWIVVISAAVTGTLTLIASLTPKIIDVIRDRSAKKTAAKARRAKSIADLRRLYLAAFDILDREDESTWVAIAAAAADCIPFTEPGSESREMLISLIGRTRIETEAFIAALPAEIHD